MKNMRRQQRNRRMYHMYASGDFTIAQIARMHSLSYGQTWVILNEIKQARKGHRADR